MARKKYDASFRAGALSLAEREGVKEAAAQLGVAESMVYKWKRQKEEKAAPAGETPDIRGPTCPTCGGPVKLVALRE